MSTESVKVLLCSGDLCYLSDNKNTDLKNIEEAILLRLEVEYINTWN